MVWRGFVVGLRFGRCFHNFYECKVSHNIEWDVCLIKKNCPLFVQVLFIGWIQSLEQWNLSKGLNVVICGFIKTFCVVCRGYEIQTPSTWDVKANFPSTKWFDISMATSFVHPFGIWVGASMLFSGGGTSPPHWANNAFTHGCAFEHSTIPACSLPSYR